jgi:Protein of unknown function (DUF3263)
MGLSERDAAILDLERTAWTLPGRKDDLVRERLGLAPTTYRKLLAALVDDHDALAHDPLLIRRLRRVRDERRRARYEGRSADGPGR